jgi:PQQ-dependent dehydrogenase (methanol/ethanol family)
MLATSGSAAAAGANVDWPNWGNNYENTHYANIDQINASNVSKLGVAFTLSAGPDQSDWETDPVEVSGVLYYSSPTDQVFAVNATNGKKIWSYTPKVNFFLAIAGGGGGSPASRGVTVADGKVFDLTFDDQLIALQQATGEKLWSAPVANAQAGVSESSPGTYWNGEYIVGSAESDAGVRGAVQAVNANTGALLWRTYLVPGPGHGWVPKLGDHGGADVWMPPTVDTKTGQVFVGTGNPSPDFDVKVRPGCDPDSDATVAMNAKTGKIDWVHEEVCNDDWDYDSHQAPSVYTIKQGGKTVNVVGAGNKSGFYSIINEATGKLIAKSPYLSAYTMPHPDATVKGVKVCPGALGGIEYSPPSVDTQTSDVYLQTLNECDIYSVQSQQETAAHQTGQADFGGSFAPAPGVPSGSMTAINDATGKIVWKDDLANEAEGGTVSTSGGIVLFGDGSVFYPTKNDWLYAVSAKTGKVLLKANLGVPIAASPMTYEVNGTQYIALAVDDEILVMKLGGKPFTKITPAGSSVTTPPADLPDLSGFTKVGNYTYYKASAKSVIFKLEAGLAGKNGGFNFDGYYGGQATFNVPYGWTATYEFTNSSALPHSVMLTASLKTPLTAIAGPLGSPIQVPAANPTVGIKASQGTAVLSIESSVAENLYVVCGVPGHLQAGMWDRMDISKSITTPSISVGTPSKTIPK